jgi:hypothetical protein
MKNAAALLALSIAASAPLPARPQATPTAPAPAPVAADADPWGDPDPWGDDRPRDARRGPWYVGGGGGYGDGSVSWYRETWSLGRFMDASPWRLALALEGGQWIGTRVRVGLDLTWIHMSGARNGANATVDLLQPGVAAAFYPFKWGLFVRAAAGYARLGVGMDRPSFSHSESYDGFGLTGGLGYALTIRPPFDAFVRIDATRQWYGSTPAGVDGATLWAAYAGLLWF